MALDPVTKVEITAHNSIIDLLLEELQQLSIIQIDPHRIKEWENEKVLLAKTTEKISDLRRELIDIERALNFIERYAPKVSIIEKLSRVPEEVPRIELRKKWEEEDALEIKDEVLDLEREIGEVDLGEKDIKQKIDELLPLKNFEVPLNLLQLKGRARIIVSKLEPEGFEKLTSSVDSNLVYVENITLLRDPITGAIPRQVYFFIAYHVDAEEYVAGLERDFRFEPLVLERGDKTPGELLREYEDALSGLMTRKQELEKRARALAREAKSLQYYYDFIQTELDKETAKEKLFYTEKVFVLQGWVKKRDLPELIRVVGNRSEAHITEIEKEEDEVTPVAYKNNPVVSPFELIVNLYSPPNPKEIDPTPILMPFYAMFFGICLTEAGYGLVITLITALGLLLIKTNNSLKKFLRLFFILGIFTFIIGALIGTVFGINFDLLPPSLAWLREARYRIMIFDSSKDVLTFFGLALTLGVLHLIAGYIIKIYMLFRDGEWIEAVCDHLPWIFLLLAPAPKVLMRWMPAHEEMLNYLFYALLALWALIIIFFSERSSWNPIKRIGKGLFTLYGVSSVLGDVLSYSRLLALGLATGVIAGVMNTLAGMVKQLPIIGIVGFVAVLLVGHLFNLFISGLSAFVHSIRLQFMEFFTKFYTGEGELLKVFSENRRYTFSPGRAGRY